MFVFMQSVTILGDFRVVHVHVHETKRTTHIHIVCVC